MNKVIEFNPRMTFLLLLSELQIHFVREHHHLMARSKFFYSFLNFEFTIEFRTSIYVEGNKRMYVILLGNIVLDLSINCFKKSRNIFRIDEFILMIE